MSPSRLVGSLAGRVSASSSDARQRERPHARLGRLDPEQPRGRRCAAPGPRTTSMWSWSAAASPAAPASRSTPPPEGPAEWRCSSSATSASGTSSTVQQARPRRSALPRAARLPARVRGAGGADPAPHHSRAPPRAAGLVPSSPAPPTWGTPYVGAGVALYDLLGQPHEGNPLPRHRHLTRPGTLPPGARLSPDALMGGVLTGRPGRRRRPHDDRGPHGRPQRRRRGHHAPVVAFCERAAVWSACGSDAAGREGIDVRARAGRQRHRRLDRRRPVPGRRARQLQVRASRASTSSSPATACSATPA